MSTPPPDVVYIVREGPNDELRFSLRSLVNVPHGRVFVVGHAEPWVDGVVHIPMPDIPDKFTSQRAKLAAAVLERDLSEDFILMNDDHYIVERMPSISIFHRYRWGCTNVPTHTAWHGVLRQTAEWMGTQGFPNPRTYECHTPLLFSKPHLGRMLERYPHERGLAVGMTYEMTGAGGIGNVGPDVKCRSLRESQALIGRVPFLSSMDSAFHLVDGHLRSLFPAPGPYERETDG